jgi:hypothetical protein
VQGVDKDPGVGTIGGFDDRCGATEISGLHPRRELEIDRQPEVAGEVAQACEVIDGPAAIGIGELTDYVSGADRCRRLEQPAQLVRIVLRSEPGKLDVEHSHVGVGET